MDVEEARQLLAMELAKYRSRSYEELRTLIDKPKTTFEMIGPSETRYYVDIYAAWEGRSKTAVRVFGCIDDGGWRAFVPLTIVFAREIGGTTYDG
jgi:hypothetical protein